MRFHACSGAIMTLQFVKCQVNIDPVSNSPQNVCIFFFPQCTAIQINGHRSLWGRTRRIITVHTYYSSTRPGFITPSPLIHSALQWEATTELLCNAGSSHHYFLQEWCVFWALSCNIILWWIFLFPIICPLYHDLFVLFLYCLPGQLKHFHFA